MGKWLAALVVLMVGGCAGPTASQPGNLGWPELPPAALIVNESAPPLPTSGPVGRGALLLHRTVGGPTLLVLADGRQLRLPDGVSGFALSPDGMWLGYRPSRDPGDQGYLLRSLATGRVITFTGTPRVWSLDMRRVTFRDEAPQAGAAGLGPPAGVVDLWTGDIRAASLDEYAADAILPGGGTIRFRIADIYIDIYSGGVKPVHVVFGNETDSCWCAVNEPAVSADGSTITVTLGFLPRGADIIVTPSPKPGETPPPAEAPDRTFVAVVLDRASGAEIRRASFVVPGSAELLADRGADLLYRVRTAEGEELLVQLNPVTGNRDVLLTGPIGWSMTVPGEAPPLLGLGSRE